MAYEEKAAYDARAELLVRELPVDARYAAALWGQSPLTYGSPAPAGSFGLPTQNGPVQVFALNSPQ